MSLIYKKLKFAKNLKKAMKDVEGDKVPFTATSLAGDVALAQRAILVENVYNAEELTNIHPRLQWDKKFSESKGLFFKSMMMVPIKDEILLGVIQVINLRDDAVFTKEDLKHANMVTQSSSLYGSTVTKALMEDFKIEADEIGKSLEFYYRVPYMKFDPKLTLPVDMMENLGGSDIHVEPGKDRGPGIARVRVDGLCREILKVPPEPTASLIARIKVMSRLDIAGRRLPQDGKCKLKICGRAVELRVATVPTVQGEGAVMRNLRWLRLQGPYRRARAAGGHA